MNISTKIGKIKVAYKNKIQVSEVGTGKICPRIIIYYSWQNIWDFTCFKSFLNILRCWCSVLLKIWEMTVTFASVTQSEPRPCPHMLRSSPPAPAKYCDNLTGAGGWGPGIYIIIRITIHRHGLLYFTSSKCILKDKKHFLNILHILLTATEQSSRLIPFDFCHHRARLRPHWVYHLWHWGVIWWWLVSF